MGAVLVAALVVIIRIQSVAAEAQFIAYQSKLTAMQEQQERLIRRLQEHICVARCGGPSCDGGCPSYDGDYPSDEPGPGDYWFHPRQLRKGGSETDFNPGVLDPPRTP